MSFAFRHLGIPDLTLIEATTAADARGQFFELYKRSAFVAGGISPTFVQDNCSVSERGVLRGLHYQMLPQAQAKLITVIRGEIFDVAVDLRPDSPTYSRWVSAVLSAANRQMLYVPEGFAHGFCVLSGIADVMYKVTAEYAPALERGVRWDDPELKIAWPIENPILSSKDQALPFLRSLEAGEAARSLSR